VGLHHDRTVAGEQRALAKERCRSGTSFAGGERQGSFAHSFGRKEQCLADVVGFEVWVQREDGFCCLPFSYEGNDSRDWNPKTAKTWNSTHLAGIGRDPLELHIDSVARETDVLEKGLAAVSVKDESGPERPPYRKRFIHRLS
jgi:hypothetical protein